MSTIDIAPAIANQETFAQVDMQSCRGAQKHAGFWLAAFARLAMSVARVNANFDRIQGRNRRAQFRVHRLDGFAACSAPADIRLIRHDDEKKASRFQLRAGANCIRVKLELVDPRGRKGAPVANHWPVQHAIPVQEDRALSYFVLSHFVCAVLSAGCETNKCQTTAWNASVCGVVFMGLTVGTITQTSATLAV